MPETPEQEPLDVLAMVLADTVLRDTVNGKLFIQGTYAVIVAKDFPYAHPAVVVYLALTGGRGKVGIKLRLVDVDEVRDPIFEIDAPLEFSDPLEVIETVLGYKGVVFPEPGEYRLQLFGAAGQPLRERRLQVLPVHE